MLGEILQTFNATSVSSNGEMHLGCSSGAFPVADSWQSLSSTSLVPMAAPSREPLNPSRSQVKWKQTFSLIFHCNSSIYSWPTQLERERGRVGGVTGGDATTDGVSASITKLSLWKPSLGGSQPAAGPLQGGGGDFGVGEGTELPVWPFPPASASLSS